MLIAAAQTQSSAVADENFAKAERFVEKAANRGAKLVVFPEIFMAWMSPADFKPEIARERSQRLDGPFVNGLRDLARRTGTWIIAGMLETSDIDNERAYNTTVVLDDRGSLVTYYRKTHMFDAFGYKESDIFAPGAKLFEPIESPFGRMGLFVCYELRFPEVARYQAERGVDFFVVPSGWVHGPMKETHWRHLVIARAIENTSYMIACDQVGHQFLGRSLLVDPMGVVLAEGSEQEDLLCTEIDPQRLKDVRHKVPSVSHRRTELYLPPVLSIEGTR